MAYENSFYNKINAVFSPGWRYNIWNALSKNEGKRFCISTILDFFISVLDILFPASLPWIIQYYIQPESENNISFLSRWLADRSSVVLIASSLFLFGIKNITAFLISRTQYAFNGGVALRITRNNLLNFPKTKIDAEKG